MRSRRYGERDVLVDVSDVDAAHLLAAQVRRRPGVLDVVPAARTLLVRCDGEASALAVTRDLAHAAEPVVEGRGATGRTVVIEVVYDGDDLADVASATGLSVDDVVEHHTRATYRAAFAGFAPGFVYLEGLDPALATARRAEPRTRVPAGSVAIAAAMTAVYPRASPGGWNLIGRTPTVMFDLGRERPALVEPGDLVRFVAVAPGSIAGAPRRDPS